MEKREDRRDRTYRYSVKAWRVFQRSIGYHTTEWSAGYFKKRGSVSCNCRRHKPGRPKVAVSLCHGCGCYQPSLIERVAGRRICRVWARAVQIDDVEV